MGSKAIQGELWGKQAADWAAIQESTGNAGYQYALHELRLTSADRLLDIGCGSGLFSGMALQTGARVTGIDASELLLEQAGRRVPSVVFLAGEMEELPFSDQSFTVVSGFNSFQYAANVKNALAEARRVLQEGGKLVAMIWGNREDCEAAVYLSAIGSLLPAPPPGASGPFALSENRLLETLLEETGFSIISSKDVVSVWDYDTQETALKGLLSSGPVARAVAYAGFEKVREATVTTIQPFIQSEGRVVFNNKFRVVIAEK